MIKRKEKQEKERKRIKKQVSELLEEKEKYSRKYIYRKDDDKTIDSYLEKFVKEKEKPESALSLDPQVKNRRKEHGIDLK